MNVDFALTLIGILVGAVITWVVGWHYYNKAGLELKLEAAELRRLNNLLLESMERAGWVRLNRDGLGNVTGFEQVLAPLGIKSSESFGTPHVGHGNRE